MAYAADTGGAIKGNILDVLVSSESQAFKLGRQNATVTILREGKG
jgi:3D (Asp-Asp-Asp) domain-containing protein